MSLKVLLRRIEQVAGAETACWDWRWQVQRGIRPVMNVDGISSGLSVRRYVYELLRGPVPSRGLIAACGNGRCVNPWHALDDGTTYSRTTLEERFWRHVERTPTCWRWTGSFVRNGYGRLAAAKDSRREAVYAHRVSWELHRGAIPDGLFVCHTCDNRWCVNPDHLWLGTNADNMRDMERKGRHPHPKKTHCKYGHEYTPENTGRLSNGGRRCLKCHSVRQCRYQREAAARRRSQLAVQVVPDDQRQAD